MWDIRLVSQPEHLHISSLFTQRLNDRDAATDALHRCALMILGRCGVLRYSPYPISQALSKITGPRVTS